MIKRLAYIAGFALFGLSLAFLAAEVMRNWPGVSLVRIASPGWLAASTALYAVSHLTTSLAWPLALQQLGEGIPVRDGVRIGLVTQIGKYLPGNVAHYVGRGALARTAGVALKTSGLSTGVELVSALGAALLVSASVALAEPRSLVYLPPLGAGVITLGCTTLLAAAMFGLWMSSRGHGFALFALPVLCLSASLLLSGLSLGALFAALGQVSVPVTLVIAAVALAWVIGFLVPGAPAGLGIREAILVAILSPALGAGVTVAGVLLHRLVTALIDALAAGIGYAWLSRAALSKI